MSNLDNRVLVYSVSTDSFFNKEENEVAKVLMNIRVLKSQLSLMQKGTKLKDYKKEKKLTTILEVMSKRKNCSKDDVIKFIVKRINQLEKKLSKKLNNLLEREENKNLVRTLRRDNLYTNRNVKLPTGEIKVKEVHNANKVVALFESSFTRALNLDMENVNESVVIVKAYHYEVLKNLIDNEFTYLGERYVFFSSSSGQMKNKKCVFVKKSLLKEERVNKKGDTYTVEDTLMCGLSWDKINNKSFKKDDNTEYGVNINKYLAYLSLQNTATTKWEDFDINQVVVCPDLEMMVTDKVEFIDRDTYQISKPDYKTLPMNVSDGVGLILPELSDKNFQFRINWGKGLLSPYDFRKHAKKVENYYITDVWGKKHHIINDNVKIILSASQLKMWKYYNSMEEYREYFEKFNCEAGKCNEEVETRDIHLSYQYIQSLVDMEYSELDSIARATNYDIYNLGRDKDVMLRSLGATEENDKKNSFQKSLLLYNNLLNDSHAKEMIKSKKSAMIKDALEGTLRVEGKRMFILPDLHGYCEFLLTDNPNPKGLLGKGEVFAKDIREGTVDILRSPQLYREHGIRENVKNDKLEDWYKTGAIHVSNWDYLCRLLQADFDGDQVNVCSSRQLVKVAKRNMKGVYPLYYEMSVAPIQKISEESIYNSLVLAFGSQIGSISNQITKIWSSPGEFTKEKLDAVKLLTMYNNFMIDYSKTNFLPKPKGEAKKLIKKYSKGNSPYFFQWVKGKEKFEDKVVKEIEIYIDEKGEQRERVKSERTPVVNMLEDIIEDKNIYFRTVAPKFDHTMLMSKAKFKSLGTELDKAITEAYAGINKNKKWIIDKDSEEYKENKYIYVAQVIKDEIMEIAKSINDKVDEEYVVNLLIQHLHTESNRSKKTLWECFGDTIYGNLERNLSEAKQCEDCNEKFRYVKNKKCCDDCQRKRDRQNARNRKRKQRGLVS
ncbi:RNA dependent RNA polymerase [Metabacillus halosaccharovorans]|uniref:RNA dependent RNA polymerase n=1 Tax=Metabacillus halosaccharovorans TaxID=930124 RepID=UPI00203BB710|nr:hypothetical protein [Metabacillus halosaccharovorans]MCM3444362.1 hypothetical protein [Metabacillus halosaccharovorans]